MKRIQELAEKNIPKAAVSAMNSCSYLARQKLVDELPGKFKIKKSWVLKQIQYRKVTEDQWPKLKARIGSQFKAMYWHEYGGDRIGKKWPFIGIPMRINTETAAARMKGNPSVLIRRNNYDVIQYKGNSFLIYKKKGKKRTGKKAVSPPPQIDMLFVFKQHVINKPKWGMKKTVSQIFEENYVAKMKAKLEK